MQLIGDSYALLKRLLSLTNEELAEVYTGWNDAELNSYLVEITAKIFGRRDERTGGHLVDVIRGEADQLGTGTWTSQSAMDLQVPVPTIDIAVAMRSLSALGEERREARSLLGPATPDGESSPGAAHQGEDSSTAGRVEIETVRNALYAGMVITYAQGLAQLQAASVALGYELRLEDVASIWRGGCIVRSRLLRDVKAAFQRRPGLPNLLLDPELSRAVASRREALALAVEAGASARVPVPGLMTALSYLDSYGADWLPFNLIQAQRDYFGAHEYRRIDEDGLFHTDWLRDQEGS
jgi:6-phosphogluconate dehydrogenase